MGTRSHRDLLGPVGWLAAGTWPLRGVVGRHARGAVRLVVAAAGLRLGLVTIEGLNPFSCSFVEKRHTDGRDGDLQLTR